MTVVGIDIGGSGSRIRVVGDVDFEGRGPALPMSAGRPDFGLVVSELVRLAPRLPAASVVAVASTGVPSLAEPQQLAAAVLRVLPARTVIVMPDAVAALAAVWGLEGGAVVAAGTGSIGLASDFDSHWARADGWGHLAGDAGGGAWIGARGIRAAMRALDGRAGGSAPLLVSLQRRFGEARGVPAALRLASNEATVLASFVPEVVAAAAEGDAIARGILAEAGRELATTALAVLDGPLPERVALVGGLVAIGADLLDPFRDTIAAVRPRAEIAAVECTALDGAVALAEAAAAGKRLSHPPFLNAFDDAGRAHDPRD